MDAQIISRAIEWLIAALFFYIIGVAAVIVSLCIRWRASKRGRLYFRSHGNDEGNERN